MSTSFKTVLTLNILVIIVGLTPAYTFLSNGFRNVSGPFEIQLTRLNINLLSGINFALSLPRLYGENVSLRQEVVNLRREQAGYNAALKENEMLKAQLGVGTAVRGGQLVLARVISFDGYESAAQLDAGKDRGVSEGNLVSYKGQLVGKITAVSGQRATLLLTVSPKSRFEAVTTGLSARGEAVGEFGNRLAFTKILPTQPVSVGDSVLEFGSRLILGKVTRVGSEGAKIFKEAEVSVLYDPSFLSEVFINTLVK